MPSPQTKRLKATVGAQRTTEDRWKEENSSIADNEDADAPRVSQWVDEDDLNDEEDEAESFGPPGNTLTSLENDLSGLPMGALRKAQKMVSAKDISDESLASDDETESSSDSEDEDHAPQELPSSTKPRTEVAKRKNKHAPMEVSSKKPVTRRRIVVNIQTPQARDPRFLSMTGDFSSQKFRQNYGFLTESRKTELVTLRENLKRARKLLTSSPRDIKQEREVEVSRLELAMKRTESAVNKDRRDTIEQEALRDAKKLEQQKQQSGKGKWYMKNTEKKELFVKARYGALAEQGGQRAVKKSIEKKRKKIAQKEKRSRPFTKTDSESSRHSIPGSNHDRHREKRRKLN